MVRRGTGFHADKARRHSRADKARRHSLDELYQLATPKLLPDDDLLGRVNAVNLEYVLGDIQTDRGNLHVDGSPHVIRLRRTTLWHLDAGSGRRPPHQLRHFQHGHEGPFPSLRFRAAASKIDKIDGKVGLSRLETPGTTAQLADGFFRGPRRLL